MTFEIDLGRQNLSDEEVDCDQDLRSKLQLDKKLTISEFSSVPEYGYFNSELVVIAARSFGEGKPWPVELTCIDASNMGVDAPETVHVSISFIMPSLMS